MTEVLQNPVPKTRRRKPTSTGFRNDEIREKETNKMFNDNLEDLRQSIEKPDNAQTMQNNLFDPEVPDKIVKTRSSRRHHKRGEDNLSFEPDTNNHAKDNIEVEPRSEPEELKPRRRRRHKGDQIETRNEELSRPEPTGEVDELALRADEDAKEPRRRRVRKKDLNDNVEMQENPVASASETNDSAIVQDPMLLEDDGQILSVMIHRTDRLKTDINAIHPMIRVNIMDMTTGKLMIKQNKDRKVTSCNEDTENVTVILPMLTQPFDFKSRRLTIPAWEEALIFNENANYLIKNRNAIFLFEVVDLNMTNSVNKTFSVQQQSSGFHQIAWGFLLPVGVNGTFNTEKKVRLQLYENGPLHSNNDSYSSNVFYWWRHGLRKTYPSTLYVTISGMRLNPQTSSLLTSRSMLPNQMEGSLNGLEDSLMPGLGSRTHKTFSMLQQWKRLPGQICHIPNSSQFKLVTSVGGSSTIAFSPDGDWLACGCLDGSENFPVLVYDIASGSEQPKLTLTGHNRIVHGLAWCPHSRLLASASADGTVRLWSVGTKKALQPTEGTSKGDWQPPASETLKDQGNGDENTLAISEKRVLCHPCFVYCVVFHPRSSAILVTAGYDRVIRVWDVAVHRKDILQQLDLHKGYINTIVFSTDGQSMYSGDSKGVIQVWKTPILELNKHNPYKEKWTRQDTIEERDLHGVIINHLILTPTGKRIFVHARDGSIRLMDLKIKALVLKFHGIINSEKNLHSCLSPCGSFLFSGTEDNSEGSQAYVWNALTGDHIAIYRDLNLPGTVNVIDYHPKCHMVAFSALGSEGSVLVYAYSAEKAQLEIGYQSGHSSPNSPHLTQQHPQINYDNMTKLEETKSKRFNNDEMEFTSMAGDYERRQTDRLSRIISTLNSVTEVSQTLRRANRSLDRDVGYGSGAEDKGRLMRSSRGLNSIPMTLNATSATKANFTFKPPVAVRPKEQSSRFLGEVVAIYDYEAQRSDELSFARGEVLKIVFRDGKNWLLGEAADGSQGYLPANYVTGDENFSDPTKATEQVKETSISRQEPRKARFNPSDEVVDFQSTEPPMNASLRSSRTQRRRPSMQSPEHE